MVGIYNRKRINLCQLELIWYVFCIRALKRIKPLERMIVEQGYEQSASKNGTGFGVMSTSYVSATSGSRTSNRTVPSRTAAFIEIDEMDEDGEDIQFLQPHQQQQQQSRQRSQEDNANYVTVTAEPSQLPARHFCSVCGYIGKYSCVRCGLRYCSNRCNNHHTETRCLKASYY
jgi:hypothetical protein